MKLILVTQRVEHIYEYDERRDCLDQRWIELLLELKLLPVPVPNNIEYIKQYLSNVTIDGILLSGGGNLIDYQGESPERDIVEKYLLEYAIKNGVPVLGVCRGMQVIQNLYSISLKKITRHVATEHELVLKTPGRTSSIIEKLVKVNSFHQYGAFDTCQDLKVIACSDDNVIEAIEHVSLPIYGIMWHPERDQIFNQANRILFHFVFGKKNEMST